MMSETKRKSQQIIEPTFVERAQKLTLQNLNGRPSYSRLNCPPILKEYVFYALNLQPGGYVRKKLELEGPFNASEAQAFVDQYAEFLNRHISTDSAQWPSSFGTKPDENRVDNERLLASKSRGA